MSPPDRTNGWGEWGRHVLRELERLDTCTEALIRESAGLRADMAKELAALNIEIASLKVKASIWGAIAGGIPATIALTIVLINFFK
jgi:hypothetical protein